MGRHRLAGQHCRIALDKAQEGGFWETAAVSAQLMGEIKLGEQDCMLAVYFYEKALRGFEELGQERRRMETMYCLGIIQMELRNHDKVLSLF
jgi:TolA-binding protein